MLSEFHFGRRIFDQRHRQVLAVKIAREVEDDASRLGRVPSNIGRTPRLATPLVAAAFRAGQHIDQHRIDAKRRQVQPVHGHIGGR